MFWPDVLHVHTLHSAQGSQGVQCALGAQGSQGAHGERMSTHCVHGGHVAHGAYEYPWYLWVSMLFLGVHGTCDLLEFPHCPSSHGVYSAHYGAHECPWSLCLL